MWSARTYKTGVLLAAIVLILSGAGIYLYKNITSSDTSKPRPPVVTEQKQQKEKEKITKIKVGEYEVKSVTTKNKSWEEVVYKSTTVVEDENKIYRTFSELYPEYTNSKKNFYIKDIILRGDVAEVHFGGDEEELVNQMGTTGPYNYTGLITFALTEDARIKKVDFKIYTQGTHFGPRPAASRDEYIYLWTIPMLKEAAKNGNEKAREILDFRTTP